MNKKAILIVLDSVGIGALADSADYGDAGADTLGHIVSACHPQLPNMMNLGLGSIDEISFSGDRLAGFGRSQGVSVWKISPITTEQSVPSMR